MVTMRKLQELDYPVICNFFANKEELRYSFPRAAFPLEIDKFHEIISARSDPSVITKDNSPIGFADLYNIFENEECYIGNFIIDKNFRKQGLAHQLLEQMISKIINQYSVKKIKLVCFCENRGALLLYKKFDFQPVELMIREFNSERVPVLLMEKRIR